MNESKHNLTLPGTGQEISRNRNQLTLKARKNLGVTVGLDYDGDGIQAAMLTSDRKGVIHIEALETVTGDFSSQEELTEGLIRIRELLPSSLKQNFVSCLRGKDIYAAQIPFRKLPPSEMESALKFELRKYLPFDIETAVIDYQFLDSEKKDGLNISMMITAADRDLLDYHLRCMSKAGIRPKTVDILPLATANAFWALYSQSAGRHAHIILHLGQGICTLVIVSNHSPFFFRNIYVNGQDPSSPARGTIRNQSLDDPDLFGDEIERSMAFYMKTYQISDFYGIHLTGKYSNSGVEEVLRRKTSLEVVQLNLCGQCGYDVTGGSGKFDIPLALALRG
ncbi:type IV pilus biogenesis protein PilM [Fibrobacterota bacterium]